MKRTQLLVETPVKIRRCDPKVLQQQLERSLIKTGMLGLENEIILAPGNKLFDKGPCPEYRSRQCFTICSNLDCQRPKFSLMYMAGIPSLCRAPLQLGYARGDRQSPGRNSSSPRGNSKSLTTSISKSAVWCAIWRTAVQVVLLARLSGHAL